MAHAEKCPLSLVVTWTYGEVLELGMLSRCLRKKNLQAIWHCKMEALGLSFDDYEFVKQMGIANGDVRCLVQKKVA